MISEQEAREAAARLKNGGGDAFACWEDYQESSQKDEDVEVAANWICQELARREWQDEPDGDGWYWCEELAADAPPQKIVRHVIGNGVDTGDIQPLWKRWTIGGWVHINGRVCKITERPA